MRYFLFMYIASLFYGCGASYKETSGNRIFTSSTRAQKTNNDVLSRNTNETDSDQKSNPLNEAIDEDATLSVSYTGNIYANLLPSPPPKSQWSSPKPNSPNIVFILLDDLPIDLLGFSQKSPLPLKTPNIDLLKNTGVYFKNFYMPIGQCGPSRAVLWSGLYPSASGVQTNDFNDSILNPNTEVLPKLLKIHGGYKTGFFGKCHLGLGANIISALKDVWLVDRGMYLEGAPWRNDVKGTDFYEPSAWSWKSTAETPRSLKFGSTENNAPKKRFYLDTLMDEVVELAKSSQGNPFFAWLAPRAPHIHTLMDTEKNGQVAYHNDVPAFPGKIGAGQVSNPHISKERGGDTLQYKPIAQLYSSSAVWYWTMLASTRSRGQEQSPVHEYIRRIYNQVGYFDHKLGQLIAQLKQQGKFDNTVFVFTADNGAFAGERGLIMKGPFMYDDMVKMPLIMSGPGLAKGTEVEALVSSVDIPATILDLAGVPVSEFIKKSPEASARSVAPLAKGMMQSNGVENVYLEYESQRNLTTPIRGVVFKHGNDRYKFVHYFASEYFERLPYTKDSSNSLVRAVVQVWNQLTNSSNDPLSVFLNSDKSTPNNNSTYEVGLARTSAFTYELYNLTNDPYELTNLLPTAAGVNSLEAVFKGPNPTNVAPELLSKALHLLAEYQTHTKDNRRFLIENATIATVSGALQLRFDTFKYNVNACKDSNGQVVRSKNARDIEVPICSGPKKRTAQGNFDTLGLSQLEPSEKLASSGYAEVLLRDTGCNNVTSCVTRYRSYNYTHKHTVSLPSVSASKSYEGVAYAIGAAGTGGAQRFTLQNGVLSLINSPDWNTAFTAMRSDIAPAQEQPAIAPTLWRDKKTCSVFTGRGKLIDERPELTVAACDTVCESHSQKTNRFCVFGVEVLKKPDVEPASNKGGFCSITGQAGNILQEVPYTNFITCQQFCTRYSSSHPKRHCQYGPARFIHGGEPTDPYLQNL